jgi:hypothetical protein
MSEVRNVTIKGDAAAAFMGSRKTRKQQGGFNSAPGPSLFGPTNIASAKKISASANAFHTGGALLTPAPVTAITGTPVTPVVLPTLPVVHQPQEGGAKKKALVLAPAKKTKSKVHLAPPASTKRSSKGTRKIRVQLSSMKKRLTRAKTIKSESKQKPIAEIRRILEEAKLVKPRADGKEVPESVLRDIYQDYMLLRNRVL